MRDLEAEWMAAMRAGDYRRAWSVSDLVMSWHDPKARDDPRLPYHQRWVWDGRPFRGCDVLVRCYHGLGDTLMFARYLPVLRHRVASLTLEAQPELVPLLSRLAGVDRVVPFVPERPLKSLGCDLEISELPYALRLAPENVPPADFCLAAANTGGIGLCWASGGWETGRDLPGDLRHVLAQGAVALRPGPTDLPVLNPDGCPPQVLETARLISRLDLVITVDTMVAHLAGSLRRPTWLLLKHDADWRWMQGRTDSPWYPTMRLFRQAAPGDWAGVIEAVVQARRLMQSTLASPG